MAGLNHSKRQPSKSVIEAALTQRLNANRPEGGANLGNFYAQRGRIADAEKEYLAALRIDPRFAAAAVNLADLYRTQQRGGEAEAILRQSVSIAPQDASARHALGLVLVRLKRLDAAIDSLKRAAEL